MITFPARLMNELFRSHAFRLGVSFHGAADAGDASSTTSGGRIEIPSWDDVRVADGGAGPPYTYDERAMLDIGRAYGAFGGPSGRDGPYSVGIDRASPRSGAGEVGADGRRRCRDGGGGTTMEHFAFSAGMAADGGAGANDEGSLWMERCRCDGDANDEGPTSDGEGGCSYPPDRTGRYDGSSLRAFVARVSAPLGDGRNPDDLALLPSCDQSNLSDRPYSIFDRGVLGVNVRMSILATELAEPYSAIRSIAGVSLRDDDIIPMTPRPPGGCSRTRSMMMPESPLMENATVTWTVGGALRVTETAIMYGKLNVLDRNIFDCVTQPVSTFA